MYNFRPDSVRIENPFVKVNDSTYQGLMAFNVRQYPANKLKTKSTAKFVVNTRIHLVKRAKLFGKEYHKVWSVFLGDMK
jgi:hypothetical protein